MNSRNEEGFSLVELMVATFIGLLICYAVLQVYLAQSQAYKTTSNQNMILSTENAISYLVTPVIRSAGFLACGTTITAISNLNAGGPAPLGTFNNTNAMIIGYNGSGATYTISQANPANDNTASHWSPTLDTGLVGQVQPGSDVVVVFGATPGVSPTTVSQITASSKNFTLVNTTGLNLAANQYGAISDCGKSIIFQITGVAGTTLTHGSGGGNMQNTQDSFPISFQAGAQFTPIQQTAFFVGHGDGGQSSLMMATLNGTTWSIQPLVPGIELMKVEYGIGSNGVVTQYVSANSVTDWTTVYSVRLGFLIAGQIGSGVLSNRTYQVLNTTVTVPADNRLRHVFEFTIQLRNSL